MLAIESADRALSVRELGRILGLTQTQAIADHLWALEKKGRLKVACGIWRGISVTKQLTPAERKLGEKRKATK